MVEPIAFEVWEKSLPWVKKYDKLLSKEMLTPDDCDQLTQNRVKTFEMHKAWAEANQSAVSDIEIHQKIQTAITNIINRFCEPVEERYQTLIDQLNKQDPQQKDHECFTATLKAQYLDVAALRLKSKIDPNYTPSPLAVFSPSLARYRPQQANLDFDHQKERFKERYENVLKKENRILQDRVSELENTKINLNKGYEENQAIIKQLEKELDELHRDIENLMKQLMPAPIIEENDTMVSGAMPPPPPPPAVMVISASTFLPRLQGQSEKPAEQPVLRITPTVLSGVTLKPVKQESPKEQSKLKVMVAQPDSPPPRKFASKSLPREFAKKLSASGHMLPSRTFSVKKPHTKTAPKKDPVPGLKENLKKNALKIHETELLLSLLHEKNSLQLNCIKNLNIQKKSALATLDALKKLAEKKNYSNESALAESGDSQDADTPPPPPPPPPAASTPSEDSSLPSEKVDTPTRPERRQNNVMAKSENPSAIPPLMSELRSALEAQRKKTSGKKPAEKTQSFSHQKLVEKEAHKENEHQQVLNRYAQKIKKNDLRSSSVIEEEKKNITQKKSQSDTLQEQVSKTILDYKLKIEQLLLEREKDASQKPIEATEPVLKRPAPAPEAQPLQLQPSLRDCAQQLTPLTTPEFKCTQLMNHQESRNLPDWLDKHLQTILKNNNDKLSQAFEIAYQANTTFQNAINLDSYRAITKPVLSDLITIHHFVEKKHADLSKKSFDEKTIQEYKQSLQGFYEAALTIRLSGKPVAEQQLALQQTAKDHFKPRHTTRRLLADALMMLSSLCLGLGILIGIGRVLSGHHFFHSKERSERERDFREILNTDLENHDPLLWIITP